MDWATNSVTSAKETLQVVTKKMAARFKNTKEFDQALYRVKTFYQHVMSPTMKDGSSDQFAPQRVCGKDRHHGVVKVTFVRVVQCQTKSWKVVSRSNT